jgi:hypothetical protein
MKLQCPGRGNEASLMAAMFATYPPHPVVVSDPRAGLVFATVGAAVLPPPISRRAERALSMATTRCCSSAMMPVDYLLLSS